MDIGCDLELKNGFGKYDPAFPTNSYRTLFWDTLYLSTFLNFLKYRPLSRFIKFRFLEKMGHFHNFLCEEMVFPLPKEKMIYLFFTQKVAEMPFPLFSKYPFIPPEELAFISCKYLHFICFVENLRAK